MVMYKFKTFFYKTSALAPSIELGSNWPPIGIESINPFGLPLLNTVISALNNIIVLIAVWVKTPLYMFNFTVYSALYSLLPLLIKPKFNIKSDLQKFNKFTKNSDKEFFKWFVGFTDAEGSFGIFTQSKNFYFKFSIGLHIDDLPVLNFIKNKLGFGNIYTYNKNCYYNITKKEDILKILYIFEIYTLNSNKIFNFLDFKKAFYLYNEKIKINTTDQILNLKNNMNTQRTNFKNIQVNISKNWLLGFIEGDGSFSFNRTTLEPVFSIQLTESELPLLLAIKQYLENNLGFDSYSRYKLNSSSIINIYKSKAVNNSKPMVILLIKNIHVLTNYLIPFFSECNFISRKGLDFEDFKILCKSIYTGTYRIKRIKDLIIKLSFTMNNNRLSTNLKSVLPLSIFEKNEIIKAKPTIEHLSDGRQIEIGTKKLIHRRSSSCIYEIIKPSGEILIKPNLIESAKELNIGFNTLKKQLNNQLIGEKFSYKGNKIKRIGVFNNYSFNNK